MRLFTSIIILSSFLLIYQGCGTIMQGTTQQVGISRSPTNANVTINGQDYGSTPMILDLKRKDSHMVRIQLDGYEPYETNITRKTSGWVWGNIVFGGLIGLAVDAAAGGMYKLTPEQIEAELRAPLTNSVIGDDGLFIAVVLNPKPSWERIDSLRSNE